MSDWVNRAIATPLSRKAAQRLGIQSLCWLNRKTAAVSLCALLCLTPFWVSADMEEDRSQLDGHLIDTSNSTRNRELGRVLERLRDAPRFIQLYGVNSYFNAFAYRSDRELWKRPDHWASPVEFLARRAGDCEDFAIAKYFALRALGIHDDQIFVAYVFDLSISASHMILLYRRPGAPDLVLDNRTFLINSLSEHRDLVPVYGFNETGAFLLTASAPPWGRAHRQIPFFHPQWAKILKKMPGGDRVRSGAEATVPAALKTPGEFLPRSRLVDRT